MESKKINQLATELAPELSDLTIIGDPTTGISKKITLSQMASLFTGTVEEYPNLASFPLVGTADTIYIALDTNIIYRWNTGTSAYVELSPNIVTSLVFNDANGFDGTISLVGSTATLTITTALTQGSIGFIGASGALTQDNSNFFWDNTNKRLGINTNAPTTAIDAFGSGIIGRLNGTSTNNAYLGFASAGSNKWSIGNVQSDHRFRIYNEATTSELVSVLQTGEFGIGIANPTTKLHIDGGASALIANLDANVSVAKSISFRSDNSNRFNIEVSGTESGLNAGANFFIRRYSDAGALIDTPLTITRSTGAATFSSTVTAVGYSRFWDGTQGFNIGAFTAGAGYGAIYSVGITPSSTNHSFASNGLSSYVNASNDVGLTINNGNLGIFLISSGKVGIGNTNPQKTLDITGDAFAGIGVYDGTNTGVLQWHSSDGFRLVTATAKPLVFFTNDAERMRILSDGKIGFGTNAPTREAVLYRSSGEVHFKIANGTTGQGTTDGFDLAIDSAGGAYLINRENQPMFFLTNGSERARIINVGYLKASNNGSYLNVNGLSHELDSSSGDNNILRMGNYHSSSPYGMEIFFNAASPNNTTNHFINCSDSTNQKFVVYSNGTVLNRTGTYGTISDINLKENIINATPKLNDLLKLKVRNFNFIGEELKQIGFIAQEMEEVFPNMIDTNKEGLKSVKTTVLIPMLVKAIQEQQEQIEELKALINK